MEGASYSLMTHPDPKLAAYVDKIVGYMADAQEDDGYLYTAWTARDKIDEPEKAGCRPVNAKWVEESNSHELYNLGHMYEAAAAHFEATGQKNLPRCFDEECGLARRNIWPRQDGGSARASGNRAGAGEAVSSDGQSKYLELTRYLDRACAASQARIGRSCGASTVRITSRSWNRTKQSGMRCGRSICTRASRTWRR